MSSIQIESWKEPVYRVHCQLCDYDSERQFDYDEAVRLQDEHRKAHEGRCQAIDPNTGLACQEVLNHRGPHHASQTWPG